MDELEGRFYEYMYNLGQADADWNREVLKFYLPYFAQCRRVLDVGCGNGQLVELLSASGIDALGIDLDTRMVESCREKGLHVIQADLFNYLPQQREQFDGIFSSNVIEHFAIKDALQFLQLAFDALRPGGVLLVATPNPESLIVHLHEFWRDATHVRLYSRSLLEFLFSWAGFQDIEAGANPKTRWTPPAEMQAVPKLLEDLTSWERSAQAHKPSIQSVRTLEGNAPERPIWRRLAFYLRRRLARFLVRTVLFEEFNAVDTALTEFDVKAAKLENVLGTVSSTLQQVGRALYYAQDNLLNVPREVFVKGTKPSDMR